MDRKIEILEALDSCSLDVKNIASPLIENLCFIENQLDQLRELPFISVNPKNKQQQKTTTAYKQYKELYQQYTVSIKIVLSLLDDKEGSEDSPLKIYFKNKLESFEVR